MNDSSNWNLGDFANCDCKFLSMDWKKVFGTHSTKDCSTIIAFENKNEKLIIKEKEIKIKIKIIEIKLSVLDAFPGNGAKNLLYQK